MSSVRYNGSPLPVGKRGEQMRKPEEVAAMLGLLLSTAPRSTMLLGERICGSVQESNNGEAFAAGVFRRPLSGPGGAPAQRG